MSKTVWTSKGTQHGPSFTYHALGHQFIWGIHYRTTSESVRLSCHKHEGVCPIHQTTVNRGWWNHGYSFDVKSLFTNVLVEKPSPSLDVTWKKMRSPQPPHHHASGRDLWTVVELMVHLNSLRPSIQFTMEKEKDDSLDVLLKRKDDGSLETFGVQEAYPHQQISAILLTPPHMCEERFGEKPV